MVSLTNIRTIDLPSQLYKILAFLQEHIYYIARVFELVVFCDEKGKI